MNIASVRALVEANHSADALRSAEEAILEGLEPAIAVQGEDEGEQLTHVMAARWVLDHMAATNDDVMTSIRAYTQRVRSSIS